MYELKTLKIYLRTKHERSWPSQGLQKSENCRHT